MTSAEMHAAVDIQLQQVGSFVYDHFEFEEVDYYLNKAQDDLVRERTALFEANEVIKADIRSVVKGHC